MNPNELAAVLQRTDELAIYPTHIEATSVYANQRNRSGLLFCPSGLTRAKVIEDGHKWIERRPVAVCGDQDYEIQRRNGVLVEFDLNTETHIAKGGKLYKRKATEPVPHSEVVDRDGKKVVQMVISRKAIVSPWGEYALIEARRAKENAEHKAKKDRLDDAQRALMGDGFDFERARHEGLRLHSGYDSTYEVNKDGSSKRRNGTRVPKGEVGYVTITLERAEEIARELGLSLPEKVAA